MIPMHQNETIQPVSLIKRCPFYIECPLLWVPLYSQSTMIPMHQYGTIIIVSVLFKEVSCYGIFFIRGSTVQIFSYVVL